MEIHLLGPVEVWANGRPVDTGGPRQRGVLAALAVDVGRSVPVETIVDRVWGAGSPDHVRRSLYTHVARIRRMLEHAGAGPARPARLTRRAGGYVLDLAEDQVDTHRFQRLAGQAREPDRAIEARAELLRQALGLWRGTPLAELPGEWAARVRAGWHQQYLDTVVCWADAEVLLGNAGMAVQTLTGLVEEHPLVEPLVAALMRTLYATGHGTSALDCYAAVRSRLVTELGVDPGPELQRLQQAILRGEPDRPGAAGTAPGTASPPPKTLNRVVPAQLPLDPPGFTGRRDELAWLDEALVAAGEQPTTVAVIALTGSAGVGKTTLAVHWAHRVADRFGDGQLFVGLRGFDPAGSPMTTSEAVRGFLDAFAVPPERIPDSLDAQVGLYRSLLADKRVLLVLDNARDADQVRPLLPGAAGCFVVVTSRNRLTGLVAAEGARPISLDLLSPGESRDLLARRLGRDRVAAEPRAVDETIAACARLPLALVIMAARAATRPASPLTLLAGELRQASGSLDALVGDDTRTDVRVIFSWSYHALTAPAARLFRLLGLHPGPDVSAAAVASLAGTPLRRIRPLLAELTRMHMLVEPVPDRYTFHDLLRAYAMELTKDTDSITERRTATHRMLDHYLHTAHAAGTLLYPRYYPITLTTPEDGVTPEDLPDHRRAQAWCATEHRVLLAAIEHAAAAGFDPHTWKLAWSLAPVLCRRGHGDDAIATQRLALTAAQRQADPHAQARAHNRLGIAYAYRGRHEDAQAHQRRALDLYTGLGDLVGQALVHSSLAFGYAEQNRFQDALAHERKGLALCRTAGNTAGVAETLGNVGWYHAQLGDYRQALGHCQQAQRVYDGLGNRWGQAAASDSVGYAYHHLGEHRQAISWCQRAVEVFRDMGDRYYEAEVLVHLGDAHDADDNPDAARRAWQQALTIMDEIGRDTDRLHDRLTQSQSITNQGQRGPSRRRRGPRTE